MASAEMSIKLADLPQFAALVAAQQAVLKRLYDGWEDVLAEDSAASTDEWRRPAEWNPAANDWTRPYEPMTEGERLIILRLRDSAADECKRGGL